MMANMLREVKENFMQSMENKFHVLQSRMDELTRVIEEEVIAEQYNANEQGIMQSMTMNEEALHKEVLKQQMAEEPTALAQAKNNLEKVAEVSQQLSAHDHLV
ncbi:hypothetical protein ElyMa_004735700 [Elysia marginata]|uniref:Uncharacterized protein n=1 Tax=Elysia marginata TaxID=1093978 RepID=A0AAV4IDK9_9GAST|nr:hypothetical protein ElyMa_004735700 [Elysia marginata]